MLDIGFLHSDSNTGGFTRNITNDHTILLGHSYCQIHDKKYDGIHFLPVLKRIVEEIEKQPAQYQKQSWSRIEVCHSQSFGGGRANARKPPLLNNSTSGPLTQSFIWQRIGRFLKPNDIVLAESGTAQFGMPDAQFPANTSYITQIFWSSIGYTVGACLGACVAAKEQKRAGRVILIVGEGSLQMTVQEIGS